MVGQRLVSGQLHLLGRQAKSQIHVVCSNTISTAASSITGSIASITAVGADTTDAVASSVVSGAACTAVNVGSAAVHLGSTTIGTDSTCIGTASTIDAEGTTNGCRIVGKNGTTEIVADASATLVTFSTSGQNARPRGGRSWLRYMLFCLIYNSNYRISYER